MAKSQGKDTGKDNKGDEVDARGLLAEIPAKVKSRALKAVDEVYQAMNKIVLAYIKQMEEFQVMASEKEA